MELADLIVLQAAAGMTDRHWVYVGPDGFRIAHTDAERRDIAPLTTCRLHEWLRSLDEAPVAPGVYLALPHEPDAYSEPYRADPWDLEPFDVTS